MKDSVAKVLVLGGDPEAGEELLHILSRDGFQVEVTPSLATGMRLLISGMFSIVVVDLAMFRGNEEILIQQVRDKNSDLAILAMGDLSADDPSISSVSHLVSSYHQKPVEKDRLISALKAITRDRGLHKSDRDSLLSTIGGRIRSERKKQSLTLKQVAERTQLSVSLLSQIERAESAASVSSLFKIAGALNTQLQLFFEGY